MECRSSLPWPLIAKNLRDSLSHFKFHLKRNSKSFIENLWGFLQSKFCIWLYTKFQKFERKSLRIVMIKVFLFHYLWMKLEKFDEKIFKFVAIKSFKFDWIQYSKSFIWKSLRHYNFTARKIWSWKTKEYLPKGEKNWVLAQFTAFNPCFLQKLNGTLTWSWFYEYCYVDFKLKS